MLKSAKVYPYIPVVDLGRARKFYESVVGLEPKEEVAGGVVYDCSGTQIFMYTSAGAGTSKASQAFWQVGDLKAEMTDLCSRGLVFEEYDMPGVKTVDGIATGGGAMTAWFTDSEGNIMAISQRIA